MLQPITIKALRISMIGLSLVFITSFIIESQQPEQLTTEGSSDPGSNKQAGYTSEIERISNIDDFSAIIERPLFSVTRRPVEINIEQDTASNTVQQITPANTRDTNNEEFLLSGIIITDQERFAFIESKRGRTTTKLGIGENISGWTLTTIESHTATLSRGAESRNLQLEVKKSPARKANRQVETNRARNATSPNVAENTNEPRIRNTMIQAPVTENNAVLVVPPQPQSIQEAPPGSPLQPSAAGQPGRN